jgi:hypothetical protein
VHKLTIHCQLKTAEEITQIANMTPLKEIRIYEAIYLKCMRKYTDNPITKEKVQNKVQTIQ